MAIKLAKWNILFMVLFCIVSYSECQIDLTNTPPVMTIDRNWRITENETIGTVVTRVRADDAEHDRLEFGLEPLTYGTYGGENGDKNNLPFRIDPHTGVVYLNQTLAGRGGENFFIYVTVSDGKLTAKNEVYVNILSKNDTKNDIYRSRPPTFTPNTSNIRQILPPIQLLPGMNKNPPYQTNRPQTNFNNHRQVNTYVETNETQSEVGDDLVDPNTSSSVKLVPVQSSTSSNNIYLTTKPTASLTTRKPGIPVSTPNTIVSKKEDEQSSSVLPIVVVVSSIFIIAGIIALFIFRQHFCTISKFLKKKSKEEMTKKSNLNTISGNLTSATEDSQNSIGMQHWLGPMAYNNRYVPGWERENQHTQLTSQLSNESSTISQTALSKTHWEFPRHRLKFFNILGEGAFGQVWRCEATNIDGYEAVQTVAVKTLKENASEAEKNDLISELQVMKRLEPHVNVVRLLGCCTEKEPLFVILEYVNKGKLQSYLRNSRAERHYGNMHGKSKTLTSGDLTSFMYQVARGMDFLTSRGIIHRDLAARNILITEEHTCKVADFGFARDILTSKIYERKSEGRLPIRWMATESLYDNLFSVKSDIWSFGILMWEIVTLGSTPYPGMAAAEVMKSVRDGFRLEKPEHCRRELYNIMYYCWADQTHERPDFPEVVKLLDKLLLTETDYIELERFPDHNYYNMTGVSGEKL